jgi:antitoxin component of RelBE/YafQ-DinJ toxin-antitoxin module
MSLESRKIEKKISSEEKSVFDIYEGFMSSCARVGMTYILKNQQMPFESRKK